MKKILILGGKPIGSYEITEAANALGLHTIVADYLLPEDSPAKGIANEHWEISTAEISVLKLKCIEEHVSAIVTGVHEFNIERKIDLCNELGLPQYCTRKQWEVCENKALFKQLCEKHEIPVARTYMVNGSIEYPVIIKPVDSSGSRGFSVCHNRYELDKGIEQALRFSDSKQYLIEEFLKCEAVIIHYTAINGEIFFSGMSDKHSQALEGGASVMAWQTFPSKFQQRYLTNLNDKVMSMFKDLGVKNGPIWIEAFNDIENGRFIFNEMGYRFGGSMTNYPVKFLYGIDQMKLLLDNALGEETDLVNYNFYESPKLQYGIFPIHVKEGKIQKIHGINDAKMIDGVEQIILVHHSGDNIQNWGTAQNVFCYLHVAYDSKQELINTLRQVKDTLSVTDTNGEELLFYLFDESKFNEVVITDNG